jgi:hypothetical protein
MNNVVSSPSVPSASPPVGIESSVPYNNSQRVMKAQAGMQMDWDAVRNVNDNGLCKLRYLTLLEYLSIPMCTMPIKIWLQKRVRYKFGT